MVCKRPRGPCDAFCLQPLVLGFACSKYPKLNDQVGEWEGERTSGDQQQRFLSPCGRNIWLSMDPSDLPDFCVHACTSACSEHDYIFKQGAVTRPAPGMQTATLQIGDCSTRTSRTTFLSKFSPSRWAILFAFKHNTSLNFFTPFSNFNHIFFYLRNLKFLQKQHNCSCFRQAAEDHIHLSSLCLPPASLLIPTLQHLFASIWKQALVFNLQQTHSKMKVRGWSQQAVSSLLCN